MKSFWDKKSNKILTKNDHKGAPLQMVSKGEPLSIGMLDFLRVHKMMYFLIWTKKVPYNNKLKNFEIWNFILSSN